MPDHASQRHPPSPKIARNATNEHTEGKHNRNSYQTDAETNSTSMQQPTELVATCSSVPKEFRLPVVPNKCKLQVPLNISTSSNLGSGKSTETVGRSGSKQAQPRGLLTVYDQFASPFPSLLVPELWDKYAVLQTAQLSYASKFE